MPDYRAMYYQLAGQVADAIELLVAAQQEGEESALQDDKPSVEFFSKGYTDGDKE